LKAQRHEEAPPCRFAVEGCFNLAEACLILVVEYPGRIDKVPYATQMKFGSSLLLMTRASSLFIHLLEHSRHEPPAGGGKLVYYS
jgi:hypothetical protein